MSHPLDRPQINVRETYPHEDTLIAEHFYQMWRDNDVPDSSIESNWSEIIIKFIDRARQELCYKAFAIEVDGVVVGSTSCQLFAGLYPQILAAEYRKYGYIWGVYVEAPYRGRGFGKQLTTMAIDYLKSLGCTRAILHASPSGQQVYTSVGFVASNEMRLDLK
ncbi:MAG: GNAT family N-acetyltransferase [Oscillatoriaceae cyanobacterium Prado104]|nr:GNAT family N-acetyltransferase [Oscillatoriaceae cyanobacterium Prado104]